MKMKLKKFYFTFGTSYRYPFKGGWVLVWAADINHAADLFREKYPNRTDSNCLNCADYYDEKHFTMGESGNLGAYCRDVIMPEGAEFDD